METDSKIILIADDEKLMAKALSMTLQRAGYMAKIVHNGKDALEEIQSGRYALTLLDISMPDMDGFTVLEKLQNIEDLKPIIVVSNHKLTEYENRSRKLGAQDYIVKSNTTQKEIVERIQKILE